MQQKIGLSRIIDIMYKKIYLCLRDDCWRNKYHPGTMEHYLKTLDNAFVATVFLEELKTKHKSLYESCTLKELEAYYQIFLQVGGNWNSWKNQVSSSKI